jgi:hypothetical protein
MALAVDRDMQSADALWPEICDARAMLPAETLSRHRDAVHAIILRHRAQNPRLFGSAARGCGRCQRRIASPYVKAFDAETAWIAPRRAQ